MTWTLVSKRKIIEGPNRDETSSDMRNLSMWNIKLNQATGTTYSKGINGTPDPIDLSAIFTDIHCAFVVGVDDGTDYERIAKNYVVHPIRASKTGLFARMYSIADNAEFSGTTGSDFYVDLMVVGLAKTVVPSSDNSVDAFA